MSDRLKALREKRGVAVKEMRDLIEIATTEKRDMSAEEMEKHSKAFNIVDSLRVQIEAEERTIEAERQAATQADKDNSERRDREKGKDTPEAKLRAGFRNWLRTGKLIGEGSEEFRAYQVGSDTEGGLMQPPQEVVAGILKNVDDQVFIRSRATATQLPQAESLGVITLDTDAEDWDWTTELLTGSEEDSLRIGKREFRPHPLAKRLKLSKTLIRKAPNFETLILSRMAYKLGVTMEKNYLTGNGVQRPLGVFTASNDGVPTTQDVSTGNTTTSITFDGLIEAKFKLKAQYWTKADWLFHRDAVKQITKLKDGDGQYLWRMSVRDGEPDSLLGRPLMVSEFAPNTFTAGLYVGMFADFSNYWIVDALNMQMQTLYELYAETNQTGFIARYEGDGAPALAEAFARVKLAP
ncbi:phage major capsid protein [Bradyrhizobium sp. AUGA SZCCT0176]|uniref:phage major capsid protein n=1 Tax=Bradyrhizobium sp. AUGA SZCCT0176 TaxID=2807664 RepID=UPI001BABCBB3|nr:phage major capsid protein [Bradyrhizobium sp. AUGA SZCCT0176]MBR1230215.1 phage major capsid protein [Bradyrhizobium sp. AUGA SZCCT0176]